MLVKTSLTNIRTAAEAGKHTNAQLNRAGGLIPSTLWQQWPFLMRSTLRSWRVLDAHHGNHVSGWGLPPSLSFTHSLNFSSPAEEAVKRTWQVVYRYLIHNSLSESLPPLHSKLLVDEWGYLGASDASITVINDANVWRHLRAAWCSIVLSYVSNGAVQLQEFKLAKVV